eukprot:2687419-Amphidinium_carterae.1
MWLSVTTVKANPPPRIRFDQLVNLEACEISFIPPSTCRNLAKVCDCHQNTAVNVPKSQNDKVCPGAFSDFRDTFSDIVELWAWVSLMRGDCSHNFAQHVTCALIP